MSNPLVSIIIPSRDRPTGLLRTIVSVLLTTRYYQVEIIPVLDVPDVESQALMKCFLEFETVIMPESYVHGRPQQKFQAGYENSNGDWIVSGSDDITFHTGWLDAMLAHPNKGYIGFYDDLYQGKLATLVMASRAYIETTMNGRFGLPWYHVHGADAEWQERAKAIGAFTVCEDAGFDHHRSNTTPDELQQFGRQFHAKDDATYVQRRKAGFPEDWPEA